MIAAKANDIFQKAISDYKVLNRVDQPFHNPIEHDKDPLGHLFYRKCWIDTVQWAYEDIIRDPNIDPKAALVLKRKIDASNQDRTDTVEYIDGYFLKQFESIQPNKEATINSESPAWALDRLSILALKIYHMQLETMRDDATESHKLACKNKLNVLLEQRVDLSRAIDELINDITSGNKFMKVYKQMKMYNDEELNPVLRKLKS
ncbi:MAG: DUF4254 domain-containing protein [Bacteroidetes bacterium]|jgi:hypothetical protein|nr:DUF4254 domain-containing protein [Bacteroidota bacterium]MDA0879025.1 DUF4254 domain-containing protein [Bacteroidota bacterium]MDA1115932.1 DUF4254 domain-containing protein [Bacteroidota bacterium]